jgi:L-ascorbate metabolism protein UlaG (beta-lactamase superfamily)
VPSLSRIQVATNREALLTIAASQTPQLARLEFTDDLGSWSPMAVLRTGGTALQSIDSAAPFSPWRFYRLRPQEDTNNITGDVLSTSEGEAIIQPRFHGTLVMQWRGRMIYVDPDNGISYSGLPKADLVLVTHSHTDHLDVPTIDAVRAQDAVIVAPQDVYGRLNAQQQALTVVLADDQNTNVIGIQITAVPAYNSNHPRGQGNGYILSMGGRRVYIAGDTGDTPEMRALRNIDVAFLPMNQPYTLTVTAATNVVTAFRPKVVYPYHYRDQAGTTTSAAQFKQRLDPGLGIEVRLRKWY